MSDLEIEARRFAEAAHAGQRYGQAPYGVHLSAVRAVLASPLYRGATIALFLPGLAISAAAPQIALFLVDDLHVSLSTAGLY